MSTPDAPEENEPVIAVLPLWQVFWFGLGGSILFGFVVALFIPLLITNVLGMSETAAEITGWAVFYPFYLLVMAALWSNAYNTEKRILGHLARVYASLTCLLFGAILVGIIVDTSS